MAPNLHISVLRDSDPDSASLAIWNGAIVCHCATFLRAPSCVTKWEAISAELGRVNFIALPMIVATVWQFLLRWSSMFMLGHLSTLDLSSASIATSIQKLEVQPAMHLSDSSVDGMENTGKS